MRLARRSVRMKIMILSGMTPIQSEMDQVHIKTNPDNGQHITCHCSGPKME